MGDWGHFPTPEAQCIDEYTMNLGFMFTDNDNRSDSYRKAYALQVPFEATQTISKDAILKPRHQVLNFKGDDVMVTALKVSEDNESNVLRFYNLSSTDASDFSIENDNIYNSNLIETKLDKLSSKSINPAEIKTLRLEKE